MRSIITRLGGAALAALLLTTASPHPTLAAGEPYVIGAIASESGPGSSLGRPEADSMQLAVDEINKTGGVNGHQLQLTIIDDQSDPSTAVNAVRKLLDQHVVALLGSSLTQTTLAMVPVVQAAKIPLISFGSSAEIIQPVSERKWIFKMPITDFHVAQVMQDFMKKRGQTKVAVIYRNDDYGKTGLSHFQDAGKQAGFDLVDAEAIASNASDATTQLTRVKAANPQAIVVWSTLPSVAVITKGYRELGLTTPLYFSDGAANGAFPVIAGNALNGAYIASTKINVANQISNSDSQKTVTVHYIDAFLRAYPKDAPVSIFGGFGYDGIYVLRAAFLKAHGTNPKSVRKALENLTYTGVSGVFRMTPADHNGLSVFSTVMTQIEDKKFKLVR